MSRVLMQRWIREGQWLLAAGVVALLAFGWVRVWVITQLEMGAFERIIEQVWDQYEKFLPVPLAHLLTYHGRVAMAYSEPMVVLCIAAWAIARGSDCVAGHVGRGTMELLLAQPVRRWQIVLTHSFVTTAGLVLLCLSFWCGVWAGISTSTIRESQPATLPIPGLAIELPIPFGPAREVLVPMSERTSAAYFVYPTLNLFALGVFLGGISTLLSASDQHRGRTIGIVVGGIVVQVTMRLLALAAPQFGWLAYATIFSAYAPESIVRVAVNNPGQIWNVFEYGPQGELLRLGPLGYDLILLVPGLIFYALAAWNFSRRDLPAPL